MSFVLSCLTVFSGASIKVAAETVPSGGHYLTVQETRDIIGSTIPFTYYNGSTYVESTASYGGYFTCTEEISENPCGFVAGSTFLYYTCSNNANNNVQHITFHMEPTYSIFDTEYIYTAFGLYGPINISSSYQSPSSDWYISGSNVHFENSNETSSDSGYLARIRFTGNYASYIPIVHRSQSTFSAYSIDADFCGNAGWSPMYFVVMCPYVSGDAFGQSGTFVTSGGSGGGSSVSGTGTDINVNVDVDMSETNSLLDSIKNGIVGLADTLVHVFVPTSEQIEDFHSDLVQLLDDTFSGQSETADALDAVKDSISNATPVDYLTFPGVTVGSFSIPQQNVNLVPLPELLPYIKLGFDFLATCLFINLVRLKIDEVLHGKVVVEKDEVEIS